MHCSNWCATEFQQNTLDWAKFKADITGSCYKIWEHINVQEVLFATWDEQVRCCFKKNIGNMLCMEQYEFQFDDFMCRPKILNLIRQRLFFLPLWVGRVCDNKMFYNVRQRTFCLQPSCLHNAFTHLEVLAIRRISFYAKNTWESSWSTIGR